MPLKRPSPLSDEAFPVQKLGDINGVPLIVKNTFIDVPSGITPSGARTAKQFQLRTAPADLNQAGWMQRALTSASSVQQPTTTLRPVPPSPSLSTGYSRNLGTTPMATPSPSGMPRVLTQNGTYVQTTLTEALNASAAQIFGSMPAIFSSFAPAQHFGYLQQPPAPSTYSLSTQPTSMVPAAHSRGCTALPSALSLRPVTTVPALTTAAAAPCHPPIIISNAQSQLPKPEKVEEDDEDEDVDSDGEPIVPAHLRNPENAPKPPPGAIHPSLGSEGHEEKQCKRCCFYPRGRCTNGYNCDFCHYEHEKRKRKNKKKKKKGLAVGDGSGAGDERQSEAQQAAVSAAVNQGCGGCYQLTQATSMLGGVAPSSAASSAFLLGQAPPLQYYGQPQQLPVMQPQVYASHYTSLQQPWTVSTQHYPIQASPLIQTSSGVLSYGAPPQQPQFYEAAPPQLPRVSVNQPVFSVSSLSHGNVPPPPLSSPRFPVDIDKTLQAAANGGLQP